MNIIICYKINCLTLIGLGAHTYSCTLHLASGQMSENLSIKIKSSFIWSKRGKCTEIPFAGFLCLCLHSIFHENFSCESLILNEGNWDVSPYLLCWKGFFCLTSLLLLKQKWFNYLPYIFHRIYRWEYICKIHFRCFAVTKKKSKRSECEWDFPLHINQIIACQIYQIKEYLHFQSQLD